MGDIPFGPAGLVGWTTMFTYGTSDGGSGGRWLRLRCNYGFLSGVEILRFKSDMTIVTLGSTLWELVRRLAYASGAHSTQNRRSTMFSR